MPNGYLRRPLAGALADGSGNEIVGFERASEPPEAPEEVPEGSERHAADALLIAVGVVAALAMPVSAAGYVMGEGK